MGARLMTVWSIYTWLLVVGSLVLWTPHRLAMNLGGDARGWGSILVAPSFGAQPLPLPGDAGQTRDPALMRPMPPTRIEIPTPTIRTPPSVGEEPPLPLTEPLPSPVNKERVEPHITSFPELTEGVGDSRALLED